MAVSVYFNRVKYTVVSAGTGDFVTSAAVTGFLTPATASITNGSIVSYVAFSSNQSEWETGQGAYTSGTTTLARTTIRESSNAGAKVSFTAAPTVALDFQAQDITNLPPVAINGATIGTNALAVNGNVVFKTTSDNNAAWTITNNANSIVAAVDTSGRYFMAGGGAGGSAFAVSASTGATQLYSGGRLSWTTSAQADTASFDTTLSRNAAGVVQFGTTAANAAGSALAANYYVGATDVVLTRDAANVLAQRNSTTAQAFQVYNTYTSATNYERLEFLWSGNSMYLRTIPGSAGGSARDLFITAANSGGAGAGVLTLGGAYIPMFAGSTEVLRVNSNGLQMTTTPYIGWGAGFTADTNISRNAAGVVQFGTTSANAAGAGLATSFWVGAAGTGMASSGAGTVNLYASGGSVETLRGNGSVVSFGNQNIGIGQNFAVPYSYISSPSAGLIQIGTSAGGTNGAWLAAKGTLTGGTLADQAQVFAITATQPTTPTSDQYAVSWTITSAGSASQVNYGVNILYAAGYTGGSRNTALTALNSAAGTGASFIPSAGSSNPPASNYGLYSQANATTAGYNWGSFGSAIGGNVNIGAAGLAQSVKNSATNIGGVFSAINTGTTPVQVGAFACLNQTTVPTVSAALIADNGAQTDAIFLARDNGTTVFTIADGGDVKLGSGGTGQLYFDKWVSIAGTLVARADSNFFNAVTLGIGGADPSTNSFLKMAVGTTAKAQVNWGTTSVAPTSPNDGDMWFDGTDFKCRVGGATKTFTII